MKLIAYCIFDSAVGAYQRPFFMQSDGQALRAFSDLCMDAEHPIGSHPEDYSLVRVGQFDDGKGVFLPEDRETLITGNEAVAASRNVNKADVLALDENISAGGTA